MGGRQKEPYDVRWLDIDTGEIEVAPCDSKTFAREFAWYASALGSARIEWRAAPDGPWEKVPEIPWRNEVTEPVAKRRGGPGHQSLVRDPSFSSYVEMIETYPAAFADAFQALDWCMEDLGSDVHGLLTGTIFDAGGGTKATRPICEECFGSQDRYGRCQSCGHVGSAPIDAHGRDALWDEHLWINPRGPTIRVLPEDLARGRAGFSYKYDMLGP